ncbi:MAG TPA: adenylosuccinate synthase [Thermoplasmatales archaeon]|nr:adenylosuccinate synthase [Thermoplasmatales archaeon]
MAGVVITGLQWGDEGKGKITDYLSNYFDCIVRYQGGDNAGHTVVIKNKKYKLHLVPSGVLQNKKVVIGNGVVVNPSVLLDEIKMLSENGINPDLMVSDRAHVIMEYHRILDGIEEEMLGKKKIGTTKRGIGPCYTDKVSRYGIRIGDIIDEENLREKLDRIIPVKQKIFDAYGIGKINVEKIFEEYISYGEKLRKYVGDTIYYLNSIIDEKEVLFEGAQGILLDIDYGTYPYTTSSNPVSGGVCTGAGISPKKIKKSIGIAKAYTTRVGMGAMPTEEKGKIGDFLAEKGNEYGTTTGRKRRCGWLDLVALKYSCMVSGIDEVALTKVDVLDGLKEVKVCTGYEVDGEIIDRFPSSLKTLEKCKPVYESMEGWDRARGKKRYEELPLNARKYVDYISDWLKIPVTIISTGMERNETIILET